MPRGKHDRRDPGPDQDSLFSVRSPSKSAQRQRPVPTVGWALCPMHQGDGTQTGLQYRQNGSSRHYVWRHHTFMTWGGTSMPCRASGVSICVARPVGKDNDPDGVPQMRIHLATKQSRDDTGSRPALCPHEKAPGIDWGTHR